MKGNEIKRAFGRPEKACRTPIEESLSRFCQENYPDDYASFTIERPFNQSEYKSCLEAAWPIVIEHWKDILKLSESFNNRAWRHEDVVKLLTIQ